MRRRGVRSVVETKVEERGVAFSTAGALGLIQVADELAEVDRIGCPFRFGLEGKGQYGVRRDESSGGVVWRGGCLFDPLEQGRKWVRWSCLATKNERVAALAAGSNADVLITSKPVHEDSEGREEDCEGRGRDRVTGALEDKLDERKLRFCVN